MFKRMMQLGENKGKNCGSCGDCRERAATTTEGKSLRRATMLLPGLFAALAVAAVSKFLESLLPIHFIGASVIALFIGMMINQIRKPGNVMAAGIQFTSKKLLKFAIILLGASLSIGTILNVGKISLAVMLFTLITCFGGGYFIGNLLNLNWKLSNLISAGTGICGGSAIAAIAPVIDAEDQDIAYAMSATFLFDMVMIMLFPVLGKWMGLSDMAYGLWAGTAVNDTSSVVAAGYAFSEAAGDFSTMVKLTRTLTIIPTVMIFSLINAHIKRKAVLQTAAAAGGDSKQKLNIHSLIPWFILAFVALALLNSVGLIPAQAASFAKESSKFLMVASLGAIGMNTDFREMKKSGINPMIHGFAISALVVVVAISVEYLIGVA